MNSKILLVEGTAGIGKSTLIDGLLREYIARNKKIRSVLNLTQALTYGPLAIDEDNNSLTKVMNKEHLDNIYNILNWSVSSLKDEHQVKLFCIIDTLHLTHCVRPGIIEWTDVVDYDYQLKNIECKLIFFKALPQTIWDRGIVPRIHDEFITDYGKKFGRTVEEIHQYFNDEQLRLEKLVINSSMEKMYLHAEESIQENIELAYNFWIK